jgi:transposase
MRAYSTDLRERIVRAVARGRTQREAARLFGVASITVYRYVRQQEQAGNVVPKPLPGGPRRIGPEQEAALRAHLEAAPEATLAEHCAWWEATQGTAVSGATMWRAIRRLGWTRKKTRAAKRA